MQKKTIINLSVFGVGLVLIVVGFFVEDILQKPIFAAMLAVGITLFGIGLINLINTLIEKRNPGAMQAGSDDTGARNTAIRHRAKAMAWDITQWFIMGIAYATLLVDSPLWLTAGVVGVFVLGKLLYLVFNLYYQKKM